MFCRSSITVSLQDFLGLPGPLLPSFGNHVNAWCGICLLSIRCTRPSHCSLIFLRMTSIVSIPVLRLISSFLILSLHVTPSILRCHLWCAASNHFIFMTVMFYVSALYCNADRTSASYNRILVSMPSLLFFQIFSSLPYTELEFAFPTLVIISLSLPPVSVTTLLKYQKTFLPFNCFSSYWHAITWLAFSSGHHLCFFCWLSVQCCLLPFLPKLRGFCRSSHDSPNMNAWTNIQNYSFTVLHDLAGINQSHHV